MGSAAVSCATSGGGPYPLRRLVRNKPVSLGVLALAVACNACGSPGQTVAQPTSLPTLEPNTPLDELQPYFVAGEQITWSVTLLGIEGVRARLAVQTLTACHNRFSTSTCWFKNELIPATYWRGS